MRNNIISILSIIVLSGSGCFGGGYEYEKTYDQSGIKTVEACYYDTSDCFYLDAYFYEGEIFKLFFEDGRTVDIDWMKCDSSYCWLEDENGAEWDVYF